MDAQDFRSLQEAYMEVVMGEGKVEWDNPKRPLKSGFTPREKNRMVRKRLETKGLGNSGGKSFTSTGPSERDYERHGSLTLANQEQSGVKTPKKGLHKFKDNKGQTQRKKYKSILSNIKEPKESYDLYDIILSHLLDEGYAETPEAAEAIMVNMSEEWRQSILG